MINKKWNIVFLLISSVLIGNSAPKTAESAPPLAKTYKGVNLSGAEYNSGPNRTYGTNYIYPNSDEIDYYFSKGFGIIRLPFDIARAYDHAYSPLNTTQLGYIIKIVDYCSSKGMRVLLDPHNFGTIYDSRTGNKSYIGMDPESTKLFADFWGRMAETFKNYTNVVFGLMNEPHRQNASEWYSGAVPAIKAIRAAGAKQLILIPGTSYSGAHAWNGSHNAAVWQGFKEDPEHNFAFEMHQYLDKDSSGTHKECHVNASHSLIGATEWLLANKFKGFLGEFAWSTDESCANESVAFMDRLANADAWLGWTWWCGGPWYPWAYIFRLDPLDFIEPTIDKPQLALLLKYL